MRGAGYAPGARTPSARATGRAVRPHTSSVTRNAIAGRTTRLRMAAVPIAGPRRGSSDSRVTTAMMSVMPSTTRESLRAEGPTRRHNPGVA
jgi:hypothetical protein